jgi:ubiquinone/menaquinone biosynthesis C-methylase UbiE
LKKNDFTKNAVMKLNWAERLVVNNPLRVLEQRLEIRWLREVMPLASGSLALEIGCGRGVGAGIILRKFRLSMIHCLDLDISMVRKAKRNLSPQKERSSLLAGDASALPIQSGTVDAVFGFGVLHHIVDWRSALGEIARVLKPAGVYFLEELYPAVYQNFITRRILLHPAADRFSSRDLRQALNQAGFSLKKTLELKRFAILGYALKEG